ncbi:MAG TPA: deoxyribose-phosphate aldolase [Bacteroidota bacterium]|nr:deoxyribose-phosphate aldolase [Bacteroidota bacterium]
MIDHTLLRPDATKNEIEKLCAEARHYGFASVCVNPSYVRLCSTLLKDTTVKVCTVIGFPLGATTSEVKSFETQQAIRNGAREVDMVINVGMLKSGEYHYVEQDIRAVVQTAHREGAITKVIIETGLLTDEEKVKACLLAKRAGADFVKTSTGFAKGGATVGDIALMRKVVGPTLGVKASGGVRSHEEAVALVESGADRIGASASVKIVTGESSGAPSQY